MSKYFSKKYSELEPYTPGEQPQDRQYIKLNTNESPFPPSPIAQRLAREAVGDLQLYSDPEVRGLMSVASEYFGFPKDQIIFTNGSDEILNFAFMAWSDADHPIVFPDVTYGFYSVYAKLNNIPYEEIPLKEDFSVNVEDYIGIGKNIILASPNAQTGVAISNADIERILESNPNNVVVIDEAYADFADESALPLVNKYDNLFVIQTYSKSRSLAGARIGFGIGSAELVGDINTLKYSTNPYNINRVTMAAAIGALVDDDYFKKNCEYIKETRAYTKDALEKLGFTVTNSSSNFILAGHKKIGGEDLYKTLKERGILVRYLGGERLAPYIRITIGSKEQMNALIEQVELILKEQQ